MYEWLTYLKIILAEKVHLPFIPVYMIYVQTYIMNLAHSMKSKLYNCIYNWAVHEENVKEKVPWVLFIVDIRNINCIK